MTSVEKLEIRAIVKFCQQMGDTPSATYEKIKLTKGNKSASRSLVFSWHKRFKDGQLEITDRKGRGRKREIDGTLVTSIASVLQKDRRYTVRELSAMFDVSIGSVYSILTKELNMRKVIKPLFIYTDL
jgi:transposase